MTHRTLISAVAALIVGAAMAVSTAAPGHAGERPVVVELFTSQGCSSCPPADKLLGELTGRDDVVALTFAVDYWDYLGWRDTLADPRSTARQRAYASALGLRTIYTPQMVVDGRLDVVGSRRNAVMTQIDRAKALKPAHAEVGARMEGGVLKVRVEAGQPTEPATIWLAQIDRHHTVPIGRGENRGRTVDYHNVVRDMTPIGEWDGRAMELTAPAGVVSSARDGCVVIVQAGDDGRTGPILGVATVAMR